MEKRILWRTTTKKLKKKFKKDHTHTQKKKIEGNSGKSMSPVRSKEDDWVNGEFSMSMSHLVS